jgi:methylated-DNA-[protein]-cysteine S-methyltransferase
MRYQVMQSEVGPLWIAGDDRVLRYLLFGEANAPVCEPGSPAAVKQAMAELKAYFAGELRHFSVPVEPEGTAFQKAVWQALTTIPFGATISYGELARRVGQPNASRAVGAANGANPISIVVPCHRVIGANGKLTGYGGGLPIKKKLLELEYSVAGRQRSFAL